ncbi:hypothetical protein J6590_073970 [Homalodisca vitripennis]|nr:hypothetical protein J6590_073970 [Homalodisca vitripennis]
MDSAIPGPGKYEPLLTNQTPSPAKDGLVVSKTNSDFLRSFSVNVLFIVACMTPMVLFTPTSCSRTLDLTQVIFVPSSFPIFWNASNREAREGSDSIRLG